jgi:hypothetical protein
MNADWPFPKKPKPKGHDKSLRRLPRIRNPQLLGECINDIVDTVPLTNEHPNYCSDCRRVVGGDCKCKGKSDA